MKKRLLEMLFIAISIIPMIITSLTITAYFSIIKIFNQYKWRQNPKPGDLCMYRDPARKRVGPIPQVSFGRIKSVRVPMAFVQPIRPVGNLPILLPINRLRYISSEEYIAWEDKIMVAHLYRSQV